jgi:hypothetical protein
MKVISYIVKPCERHNINYVFYRANSQAVCEVWFNYTLQSTIKGRVARRLLKAWRAYRAKQRKI